MTKIKIANEDYRLSLQIESLIELEDELGYNPLEVIVNAANERLPKLREMVLFLKYAMKRYNHSVDSKKAMELFKTYLNEGHEVFDLIPIFVEVLQNDGVIGKAEGESESKN